MISPVARRGAMAQISSHSVSQQFLSTAGSNVGSVDVIFPRAPAAGDILVVFAVATGSRTCAPPAGWTQQWLETADSGTLYCFTRVCGGSETNSYVFTFSSGEYNTALALDVVSNIGVDHALGTTGNATTAATDTHASALVVAAATQNSGGGMTWSGTPGFTVLQINPDFHQLLVGYTQLATTAVPSYPVAGADSGTVPLGFVTVA